MAPRRTSSALLADSHVHLDAFGDEDVAAMLQRAREAGVHRVMAVSVDVESARRTVELSRRHPGVAAAVGLHPARLRAMPTDLDWAELERIAADPSVVAIGECGVDAGGHASGLVQLAVLARHCRLALSSSRPLLLHLVGEALIGPALGTLTATGVPPLRAVAHYFQGDLAQAQRLLEAGLFIAVGKPVVRLEHLRHAVREIPLDSLLLETDTYPLPDRTTEPADVRLVAQAVAEIKGLSLDEVADATTENLDRLLVGRAPRG
jgi:TatD DNase family protein